VRYLFISFFISSDLSNLKEIKDVERLQIIIKEMNTYLGKKNREVAQVK
jgi:hypothetical protein